MTVMENLKGVCADYFDAYKSLYKRKQAIFETIQNTEIDLEGRAITDLVYAQMVAFWDEMNQTNTLLARHKNTQAAEFFNETVCLYVKAIIESLNPSLKVEAEKPIQKEKTKKSVNPDISIWRDQELIAVIELKVSDGFKGKYLLPHLIEREETIHLHHPKAKFFTVCFWKPKVFDSELSELGNKYIYLVEPDRRHFDHDNSIYRIETIIKEICAL
jgi:hypothetical protein